jgi:hypothetical protein
MTKQFVPRRYSSMDVHPKASNYPEPNISPAWTRWVQGRRVQTLEGPAYRIETTGRYSGTSTFAVATSWVSLEDVR